MTPHIDNLRAPRIEAAEAYNKASRALRDATDALDAALKDELKARGIDKTTPVHAFDAKGDKLRKAKSYRMDAEITDTFGVRGVYGGYITLMFCRKDGSVGERNADVRGVVRVEKVVDGPS